MIFCVGEFGGLGRLQRIGVDGLRELRAGREGRIDKSRGEARCHDGRSIEAKGLGGTKDKGRATRKGLAHSTTELYEVESSHGEVVEISIGRVVWCGGYGTIEMRVVETGVVLIDSQILELGALDGSRSLHFPQNKVLCFWLA